MKKSRKRLEPFRRGPKRFRRLLVEQLEARILLTTEIEPNDSFGTATLFTSPTDTLAGEISSLTDVDTFRVELTQGQALIVDVCSECVVELNEPTRFGPHVEILDSDTSTVRAQAADGRGVVYTAHADGTYLVRLTSAHALGDFVDAYEVATVIRDFTGLSESEPNDTPAQAQALGTNFSFAGAFSSSADADHFSIVGSAGETLAVDFSNDPAHAPALRLYGPSGQLVAENASGLGVYAQLPEDGTYLLEVYVAPDTSASLNGYVGTAHRAKAESLENESADGFEHASAWDVTNDTTYAFGSLSSVTDVDVFAIELDPLAYYSFSIVALSTDQPKQGRLLSLYNEHGQFLQASTTGSLETWDWVAMPSTTSKFFLVIEAEETSGLGVYELGARKNAYFPNERDVPLFVHDYTAQGIESGARWNNPFDRPDAIDLLIGLFNSQYDVYDVDVTQTLPPDASEYVSLSLGDLDNGGFGGGDYGTRRPDGFAYCPATGDDWDEFADVSRWVAVCMPHELGHGVGMRHARDPMDVMGYANQADGFSVASHFVQNGGDARAPFPKVQNTREYLDWALQAGYYVREEAGNDAPTTPQDLDASLAIMTSDGDPRNDRVVVLGRIETSADRDYFAFTATAGESVTFDIDAAEFQYPLDAQLTLYDAQGDPLATNTEARDWDTGLDSVDPLLRYTFVNSGTYILGVSSAFMTVGDYRLKVTPDRALDNEGPHVIGALPDGDATVDSTGRLIFWFDSQLDPDSLTEASILVEGSATGLHPGVAAFDPLDSTLIWQANDPLPPDTYTVRIVSGAGGVRDLKGNALDGETSGVLSFPSVSGDGQAGGDFVTRFTVSSVDTTPVAISSVTYERHPNNRGMFELYLNDDLDVLRTYASGIVARGHGSDGLLDTADDVILPLDVYYPKASPYDEQLFLYTRGIPDAGQSKAPDVRAGTSPWFVAVEDFNADGKSDLAVANFSSGSVSVLLGNGDGSFQDQVSYATGSKAGYVAVGDFDEDGARDLVVVNNGDSNLSVLLGNGDGSFQTPVDYPVGNGTSSVAVADFNGDGHLDLAVTALLSGDVSILRGGGDGTFVLERSYSILVGADRLAAADFNGDSKTDVAVANVNAGWVRLLLGGGDGTFTIQGDVTVGAKPEDVQAGDLNGDGKQDLVVANRNNGTLTVRLGNGDGTFQAAATYDVQARPVALQLADINNDGETDVVVTNRDSDSLSILLGVGDGTFHSANHLSIATAPRHLAMADVDNNGHLDLAIAYETGVVGFLLKGDDGAFHKSGYRLEGTLWDAAGHQIALSQPVNVDPDPVLRHGPSVVDLNVRPGAAVNNPPDEIEVRFNGALDPSTLTTENVSLRFSTTPDVFGATSSLVAEADGQLSWDPTSLAVKFEPSSALANGYYLLEINGDVGGVADTQGGLLDGEYLDAGIVGNTTFSVWQGTPSGDGIPGGDYRAYFVVAQPALEVEVGVDTISEFDGSAVATVRRVNVSDLSQPVTVNLTSSDTTEAKVPPAVIIEAGAESATFVVQAVNDYQVDANQSVDISAMATGYVGDSEAIQIDDAGALRADTLFFDSFENGPLNRWSIPDHTTEGRVEIRDLVTDGLISNPVAQQFAQNGNDHSLLFDSTRGSGDNAKDLSVAILTLDLSGVTDAMLTFHQLEDSDENDSLPDSHGTTANGDGLAISNDGTDWYRLEDIEGNDINRPGDGLWQLHEYDLGAQIARINNEQGTSLSFTSDFQVKFSQYDDYAFPSDGWAIDNVMVFNAPQYFDVSLERGAFHRLDLPGEDSDDFVYRVAMIGEIDADTPILVSVHGSSRGIYSHTHRWLRFAGDSGSGVNDLIIVSPFFSDEQRYDNYNDLSWNSSNDAAADEVLLDVIDEITAAGTGKGDKFYLWGFSAGGQFTQRFGLAHPDRLVASVVGGPASHAQPLTEVPFE